MIREETKRDQPLFELRKKERVKDRALTLGRIESSDLSDVRTSPVDDDSTLEGRRRKEGKKDQSDRARREIKTKRARRFGTNLLLRKSIEELLVVDQVRVSDRFIESVQRTEKSEGKKSASNRLVFLLSSFLFSRPATKEEEAQLTR